MEYEVKKANLVNGDDLFLYIFEDSGVTAAAEISGATPIAFATSCSLQINGDQIDVSNKMSCRWNANIAGKNSYTVSSDALYTTLSGATSFDKLLGYMLDGAEIGWAMAHVAEGKDCLGDGTFEMGDVAAWGYGMISSLSLEAGNNEIASSSIEITGTGAVNND